jgi:hypothetical protein
VSITCGVVWGVRAPAGNMTVGRRGLDFCDYGKESGSEWGVRVLRGGVRGVFG